MTRDEFLQRRASARSRSEEWQRPDNSYLPGTDSALAALADDMERNRKLQPRGTVQRGYVNSETGEQTYEAPRTLYTQRITADEFPGNYAMQQTRGQGYTELPEVVSRAGRTNAMTGQTDWSAPATQRVQRASAGDFPGSNYAMQQTRGRRRGDLYNDNDENGIVIPDYGKVSYDQLERLLQAGIVEQVGDPRTDRVMYRLINGRSTY